MNMEVIGTYAGLVWNALNDVESHSLPNKKIKRVTKLKDKELYAAIGWLGREGKLDIAEIEGDIVLSLVK